MNLTKLHVRLHTAVNTLRVRVLPSDSDFAVWSEMRVVAYLQNAPMFQEDCLFGLGGHLRVMRDDY